MDDSEFIELRSRFILGILICIVFLIPVFFFLYNRLIKTGSVMKKIQKNDSFIVFVIDNHCQECSRYQSILRDRNIDYVVSNKDKDIHYEKYLEKLDMSESFIKVPTVIYIENGHLFAFLPIEEEGDLLNFLDSLKNGEVGV